MMAAAQEQWSWTSNGMIALYIALGVLAAAVAGWLLVRRTLRTRLEMVRSLRQDPDMSDWLVIFGWTPKVLYVPTILAAVSASILMFLQESGWGIFGGINPRIVGGVWFAVFLINFLIEEYSVTLKLLIIFFACTGFLLLWLHLLGWVTGFLGLFTHLAFSISGTGYLLIAVIGALTIGISWLRGLFYYIAITPNNLGIQSGPAEAGEQIGREDYSTKVDTSDFLERLLGFGRIIVIFKDRGRPPLNLLVWRVDRKAEMLEKVRAKLTVDQPQAVLTRQPVPPPGTSIRVETRATEEGRAVVDAARGDTPPSSPAPQASPLSVPPAPQAPPPSGSPASPPAPPENESSETEQ
ncbi:MAG: hypothetical protein MUC88_25130 [Planctomycetes bacterium]|jgi:hypothetical protein|nr:hypothetical protein [Planctomycetota bacterium]